MPRKCCADVCKTNYLSQATKKKKKKGTKHNEAEEIKVRVFGFPKDSGKRIAWINALPNKVESVTDYMGICEKHWPPDFPIIGVKDHDLLLNPPSVSNYDKNNNHVLNRFSALTVWQQR